MRSNASAHATERDACRFAASTPVEAEMIERLGLDNASPAELALSSQPTRANYLVIQPSTSVWHLPDRRFQPPAFVAWQSPVTLRLCLALLLRPERRTRPRSMDG